MNVLPLYRVRLADPIAAGDVTPMMVFPIGEWHSAKYPDLPLTEDLANELIANFEAGVLGTEPVVDSSGKHDTSTPAAGWVKRVYLASYEEGKVSGLALWADVKWTELGAGMLTDEQYKYGSVEIGSVVLNDSGETVDNVLRSLTLTNTPVLRLMPNVQNAAEKQRDVVTLSLSEYTLAEPGSFNALRDALELAIGEAHGDHVWVCDFGPDWVVYEQSLLDLPSRSYKAAYATTPQGITLGDPVEVKRETSYVPVSDGAPGAAPVSSSPADALGMAAEGTPAALSEDPAAQKGADTRMKTVIQHLKLAEGASESDVLAAVVKLAEERDAEKTRAESAEVKLAEVEKAAAVAAFAGKLDEKIAGGFIGTGERETFVKLADEQSVELAESLIAARTAKVIDLGERGSDAGGQEKPATVELADKSAGRAAKDGISLDKAQKLTLAEDPDLAARIYSERYGKGA